MLYTESAAHRKAEPGSPWSPREGGYVQLSVGLSFPIYPTASPEWPAVPVGRWGETPGGTSEGNGTGILGGRSELPSLEVGRHSWAKDARTGRRNSTVLSPDCPTEGSRGQRCKPVRSPPTTPSAPSASSQGRDSPVVVTAPVGHPGQPLARRHSIIICR